VTHFVKVRIKITLNALDRLFEKAEMRQRAPSPSWRPLLTRWCGGKGLRWRGTCRERNHNPEPATLSSSLGGPSLSGRPLFNLCLATLVRERVDELLEAAFLSAVEQAMSAFLAAGQPLVVHDLARHLVTDHRGHQGGRSPVSATQVASAVAPDKRDEFPAQLRALVAGLKPRAPNIRGIARAAAMHPNG